VEILSGKIVLEMEMSREDIQTVIFIIKKVESETWTDYFINDGFDSYVTGDDLEPETDYMFQFYVLTEDGQEINSIIYHFTTPI